MSVCIDYDTALTLVNDEVAKEGPDYIYPFPRCVNVREGEDGELYGACLVGRAVIQGGVPVEDLILFPDADIETIRAQGIVKLTEKAEAFLVAVQTCQDDGGEWGTAVHWATERANGDMNPLDDTMYR